jgi:hypothetical protein
MPEVPRRPISDASTRELFGELVIEASCELGSRPSPMASGYLVDLLDARVRSARVLEREGGAPETLAESLVAALLVDGTARIARLRALGDRALFDAGFFGDCLRRKTVGIDYYAEIGSTAYARLSKGTGSPLFRELASGFLEFVELLAEVGERARGSRSVDLLRLYDRYRASRSPRDRARLVRHGLILPDADAMERPQ